MVAEGARFPVKSMEDLERLGHRMKWQWFEKLVAWIFGRNGFETEIGAVKKRHGLRRQYDVIAEGHRHVFAADCKRWTGRRYKSSQLKGAADRQVERCLFLRGFVEKPVIPLIVTLMQEETAILSGVPVVPVGKLNAFLNGWEESVESFRRV